MFTILNQRSAKIFPARIYVDNPKVVISYPLRCQTLFREDCADGTFCLVFPKNGLEHVFLRSLVHGVDKFAPANGGGVLVRAHLLPALNQ